MFLLRAYLAVVAEHQAVVRGAGGPLAEPAAGPDPGAAGAAGASLAAGGRRGELQWS